MYKHLVILGLACAWALAQMTPANAASFTVSGEMCWTGTITFIETTYKDAAWSWKIDGKFTSEDNDPMKASSLSCIASNGLVDGMRGDYNYYCREDTAAGLTFMHKGKLDHILASETTLFGGIAKAEGIAGTTVGSEPRYRAEQDLSQGKLSGCRDVTMEYTLPDR